MTPSYMYLAVFCYSYAAKSTLLTPLEAFLPVVNDDYGFSSVTTGIAMGSYSAANLLISPCTAYLVNGIGRRNGAFIGLLIAGLTTAAKGAASYLTDKYAFLATFSIMNFLTGASVGLFYTSVLSGVSFMYRDVLDRSIGILKAHVGIGSMLGMLIVTPVYSLGGFPLSCFFMALLAIIGSVLIRLCIPQAMVAPEGELGY